MKKLYTLFGLTLVGLLIIGSISVNLSQSSSADSALRKLGKGEQDFQLARKQILFMMGDPSPALYKFLGKKKTTRTAKIQALKIIQELSFHQDMHDGGKYVAPLLNDTSRGLRLEVLKTIAKMQSVDGIENVTKLYKTTADSELFFQCYSTLKQAMIPTGEKVDSAMQFDDTAYINKISRFMVEYPVAKGLFYSRLSRYYSTRGDFAKASTLYKKMGVINKWWTIGEFVVKGDFGGQDREMGPEKKPFNSSDVFPTGEEGTTRWVPLQRVNGWGDINIRNLFARQDYTTAYFFTYIISPDDRNANIFCQADDWFHVWINDSLAYNQVFTGNIYDEQVIPVKLHKGVNRLMVKVYQGGWGWGLFCRLADLNGDVMNDCVVSLSETPSQSKIDNLIVLAEKGSDSFSKELGSTIDPDDDQAVSSVLTAILDNSQPYSYRAAAITVLNSFNKLRKIPAGEAELIDLAGKLNSSGKMNDLLNDVIGALIEMKTIKALDIGIACRKGADPSLDYLGNQLINLYCRSRIFQIGNTKDSNRRPIIERMVNEIESLNPNDPWVVQQIADFRMFTGENDRSKKLLSGFTMGNKWFFRQSSLSGDNPSPAVVNSLQLDTLQKTPNTAYCAYPGMQDDDNMYVLINKDPLSRKGSNNFLFCSIIRSEIACSAFVNVSLPASYTVWINGICVGENSVKDASSYVLADNYKWQRHNFDMTHYKTVLNKGKNIVTIVFKNDWFTDALDRYFRCSFSSLDGKPIITAN